MERSSLLDKAYSLATGGPIRLAVTFVVLLVGGFVVVNWYLGPTPKAVFINPDNVPVSAGPVSSPRNYSPNVYQAWVMAQEFINDLLKSPSTASYGRAFGESQDPEECVKHVGDGRYEVHGWVDSQNAFGATVRTDFSMTIRDAGDGKWEMIGKPTLTQR